MSKDGPPISSGYRHGGLAAFRTGLPASATALPSRPSEGELQARQTLAQFANYPERAKSLGKPVPTTKGMSRGRAASLQRIEELKLEESVDRSVTISESAGLKTKWVFAGANKNRLVQEDAAGIFRISITYGSKDRAVFVFEHGRVLWCRT